MTLGDLLKQGKASFKSAWPMLFGMWFVFVLTFIIFPGAFFKSHLNFMEGMKDEIAWYCLAMILLFNIMDTVGRKLGGKYSLSDRAIPLLSLARIVFIPVTIMIALKDTRGVPTTSIW